MTKTNTSKLREEFEKRFPTDYTGFGGIYSKDGARKRKYVLVERKDIWNFIDQALKEQRGEIVKKLEKIRRGHVLDWSIKDTQGWNEAIDQAIKEIQK